MTIKIFKKDNASVRKISSSYSVSNLLTAKDSDKVSVAVGNAIGHDETTKTMSDRAYYVLEGEIIVDKKIFGHSGDAIFIPANTKYNFRGTFRAIIVNAPPFKKTNESIGI